MEFQRSDQPLRKHVSPFLDYCEVEKGLSSNNQRNYDQYLRLFTRWLDATSATDLLPHELTTNHIWEYRLYLARKYVSPTTKKPLSKKSQNFYLTALRALLNFLADRDIETLPSAKIKLAKQKAEAVISFLEIDDVEAMLAIPDLKTPSGLRDRTIMEVLFSSGLRIAELVALDRDQLSMINDGKLDRTYELSILGKGRYVRTIFISPRSADWLRVYLETRHHDTHPPLFINYCSNRRSENRLTPRSIQKMISRCARLAGLSQKVTPHTLRHTYATDLLNRPGFAGGSRP